MNAPRSFQPERDLVAEARQQAYDIIAMGIRNARLHAGWALERWDKINPEPHADCKRCASQRDAWRQSRDEARTAFHEAGMRAFWFCLEMRELTPRTFGAAELPEYQPPLKHGSEYRGVFHSTRYSFSRRFCGALTSIAHKRNLYGDSLDADSLFASAREDGMLTALLDHGIINTDAAESDVASTLPATGTEASAPLASAR